MCIVGMYMHIIYADLTAEVGSSKSLLTLAAREVGIENERMNECAEIE